MSEDGAEDDAERKAIDDVADRLIAKHPEVNQAFIRELVAREYEQLRNAKLREHIPVLVEHAVKQSLRSEKAKQGDLL
ncbi:hypothetical protein GCM10027568_24350 [Humibacter soli]